MARPLTEDEREELTAYLDGEADATARARVEARLNSDASVRAEADALKKVWELLDTLPQAEPSPTFTSKTLDRLTAIRPVATPSTTLPWAPTQSMPRSSPWPWLAVAGCGLLAGWLAAGYFGPRAAPALKIDDPLLVRELRLIENLPLYTTVQTMEYLGALDKTNRFDADAVGP